MVFIDKIVILVQFLIGNPFVFFNICGGTAGLCTVCAVLGTVAAAGIGQNMDADVISFIFSPEFFSTGDQIIQLIREGDGRDGRKLFDFIMVTKYLERIGDHATNIAEWVEFAITGVHKDSAVMH